MHPILILFSVLFILLFIIFVTTYTPKSFAKKFRILEIKTQGETYYIIQQLLPFYNMWKNCYKDDGYLGYDKLIYTNRIRAEEKLKEIVDKINKTKANKKVIKKKVISITNKN